MGDTTTVECETYPSTIAEALRRWDAGESVWSINMGGMAPGYEKMIQVSFMELLRAFNGETIDGDTVGDLLRPRLIALSNELDLELSCGQAGGAMKLAYQFLTRPWAEVMEKLPASRHIRIPDYWTRAKP